MGAALGRAVVGLVGKEGAVIRLTLLPFLYYALLPGAIGYAVVWSADRGILNIGTVLAVAIAGAAVFAIARLGKRACRDGALSGDERRRS